MFRNAVLICGLSLCALSMSGCKEDSSDDDAMDPGDGGKPPAEMVADWAYVSVTVDGTPASLATVLEWVPDAVQSRVQILANSAYVYQEVNSTGGQLWFESGFVFIDGDELDVNAQLNGDGPVMETTRMGFMLNGDMMTLQQDDGGSMVVFELTK